MARLKWTLGFVRVKPIPAENNHSELHHIADMLDYVHVDEKWFFMTRTRHIVYLLPGEKPPHRTTNQRDSLEGYGAICCCSSELELCQKRMVWWKDRNMAIYQKLLRQMQQLESFGWHPSHWISKCWPQRLPKMLVDNVLPAIKAKWPEDRPKTVFIQQDNARPLVGEADLDVMAACCSGGWNISIKCQPPNSPDLNVLDLGFFRAIQAL